MPFLSAVVEAMLFYLHQNLNLAMASGDYYYILHWERGLGMRTGRYKLHAQKRIC